MSYHSSTSLSSSAIVHDTHRTLNTWDDAKETVVNTYEGLKNTVMNNVILSICIAGGVLLLLFLCCFLRCKYRKRTKAQAMTRRQHDRLMDQRTERRKTSRRKDNLKKGRMNDMQERSNLANSTMETSASFSPRHEVDFRTTVLADNENAVYDIENRGVEMKLNDTYRPIAKNDSTQKPKRKSRGVRFGRNRGNNMGTF